MKRIVLLNIIMFCCINLNAQTPSFNYSLNFDSGIPAGVVTNNLVSLNNNYYSSASNSIRLEINSSSQEASLELPAFATANYHYLRLEFEHICKIQFVDFGLIEYSIDGGTVWERFIADPAIIPNSGPGNCYYLGSGGVYYASGNAFSEGSYIDWHPGDSIALPDNSYWWKREEFIMPLDWILSSNSTSIKIRFMLQDGGNPSSCYGWLIDDISVSLLECNPFPSSILCPFDNDPYFEGTVYGPLTSFTQTFSATNIFGVQAAQIKYKVNGGVENTTSATLLTNPDRWSATIPGVSQGDEVSWKIEVLDNTSCNTVTTYPSSGYLTFRPYEEIVFPFCDEFNVNSVFFETGSTLGNLKWRTGTQSYDGISFHSQPRAWVLGNEQEYSNYKDGYECSLTSIDFDVAGYNLSSLSFWYYTELENNWDGFRLEYSIDLGQNWILLGNANGDLNGTNWYNCETLISSGLAGWTNNTSTLLNATYNLLSVPAIQNADKVRFRFVFNSDHCLSKGGIIIDDFCLSP
jgi:hypothetical protein